MKRVRAILASLAADVVWLFCPEIEAIQGRVIFRYFWITQAFHVS